MNIKVIFIFVAISLFLSLIWFPVGQVIGGGDVGIPTFLPQRALAVVSNSWWETQATGTNNPSTFTALPFYMILAFLDQLGIGSDLTQKGLFILILAGGAISIYFLAREFEFKYKYGFLAGLFYIFNLSSLSIWHRGVHNAMLMLLLLPVSLLIIIRGVRQKKYLSILWVNIISTLSAYVYGTPAYIAAVWLLWLTFLLTRLRFSFSDKKERKFIITYTLILLVAWVGLNAWWLLHFLESSEQAVSQFSAQQLHQRSSEVVEDLKIYTKPEYILRGLNAYYHYGNLDWGTFYLSPFAIFISWVPVVIIFFTLLVKENYKKHNWIFLVFLIAIVIFIAKGVDAPLGGLNRLAYDNIAGLAVLRNPYEKIGILLVIPYSLLFALGCSQILQFVKINKGLLKLFVLGLIFTSMGILVWPLWRGEVFRSEKGQSYFKVPSYYAEASKWFEEHSDDTRILHLPLAAGESVDYNWGYTGIEPSQLFFPGSSIAYLVGLENVDSVLRNLLVDIHNQDNSSLTRRLSLLNAGWIVVHNETVWRNRSLEPVERINAWLQTKPEFIEHITDFGPLSIWRIKDQYRLGHFFITNALSSNEIIKPKESMIYHALELPDEQMAFNNLAEVNYLPDSLIYPLVILKENASSFLNQNDMVLGCIALSGKRLKEAGLLYRQAKFPQTNQGLRRYNKQLEQCLKISKERVLRYMSVSNIRSFLLGQLVQQKTVIDAEFKNAEVATQKEMARTTLRMYLTDLGIISRYDLVKKDDSKQRIILNYFVAKEGIYNIAFEKFDQEEFEAPPRIVQIDKEAVDLSPVEKSAVNIRYPSYRFTQGFHEIHLEQNFKNILESQLESKKSNPDQGFTIEIDPKSQQQVFTGQLTSGVVGLTFNLPNIEVGQNYRLSFDTLLNQGKPPVVVIAHDSDPLDAAGNPIPAVKYQINSDSANWTNIKMNYSPVLNATAAKLSLMLAPLDSTTLFQTFLTAANFKNIRFEKIPNNLVLEEVNNAPTGRIYEADIDWKKINPALYEVTLNNQKPPYTIVFSETFHNSWQIVDSVGSVIDLPHFSVNGYANAWLVKKPLPQKVYVKFALQDTKYKGILMSVVSLCGVIIVVVFLDRRKRLHA